MTLTLLRVGIQEQLIRKRPRRSPRFTGAANSQLGLWGLEQLRATTRLPSGTLVPLKKRQLSRKVEIAEKGPNSPVADPCLPQLSEFRGLTACPILQARALQIVASPQP